MHYLLSLYSFLFGLFVGSFLNVVILRLPNKKDLVFVRSACPKCNSQLCWYHNIPLLSFIFLRGKCSFCHEKISWRYPLIELLTALISLGLAPNSLEIPELGLYFFYFVIACIFLVHLVIDIEHHLLLDSLNLYLLGLIFPYSVMSFPWQHWLIGGGIGFGVTLLVTWFFYKLRGQIGLGGGDIKLYGILGLLLGPMGIIQTIFLSCLVGAMIGLILIVLKKMNKDHPMAFGPYIILVATFQIYFPREALMLQSWLL